MRSNRFRISRGTTLIEMMIVVAILGVFFMVAPNLYTQVRQFFFLNNARIELQREARTSFELITRRMRQASSSTMTIGQVSGQPFYSKITFTDIDGHTNMYYQNNKNLVMSVDGSTRTLSGNLRYLAFALPRSDNMEIVSVSLTLEKTVTQGKTKALHMASEKVRILND